MLGIVVLLKRPIAFHFKILCSRREVLGQNFAVHGSIHSSLYYMKSSSTFGRETAPYHNITTTMFDGWDGVLRFVSFALLPPNFTMEIEAK